MSTMRNARLLPTPWASNGQCQPDGGRTGKCAVKGSANPRCSSATAKPEQKVDDFQVVQRARGGDPNALAELFLPHRMRLYRSALSILRNKEDAEDALQDALLSAYVNLGSFRGQSRFSTWLTRIVINASLMNRRRMPSRTQLSFDVFGDGEWKLLDTLLLDRVGNPEETFRQVENLRAVHGAINQLSPCLRSALHLRDIQLVSIAVAATQEGTSTNTMKSRVRRARRRLGMLLTVKDINL